MSETDTQTAELDELVLVKYVRNADTNNNTGEINLRGDRGRENIAIGGEGYLTVAEMGFAAQHGIELAVVEKDEVADEGDEETKVPQPKVPAETTPASDAGKRTTPPVATTPSTSASGSAS